METGQFLKILWIVCGQVIKILSTDEESLKNRIQPNIQREPWALTNMWGQKASIHSIHRPYDYY
jgi:hypothetical protein